MDNPPVFQSTEDGLIWKTLNDRVPRSILIKITETLMKRETVHPALLVRLMDVTLAVEHEMSETSLKKFVGKSRPQDCSPAIRAAEIFVSKNDITSAARILADNRSKDLFHRSLAEAEIYFGEGDENNALISAKRAVGIDPSCMKLYDILESVDPKGCWKDRRNLQLMLSKEPSEAPSDPRLNELYSIYRDWYGGDKDSATDRLVGSEYYKSKDWEFILASARMSVDEKDWRSAKMMFDRIIDTAPDYVVCEAAEAYIAGRDPEYALKLYEKLDQTSVRVMQGMIAAYAQMRSEKDLMESVTKYLDNEYCGVNEYADCVNMLLKTGRVEDARTVLDTMKQSNRKNPVYLVALSSYLIERGDYQGAKRAAKDAMRQSKRDTPARIQMTRIRLIGGDVKGADRECEKILFSDPDNLDALILKKDILVAKDDVKTALEVCRKILDMDPTDVYTMMTLSGAMTRMGDDDGSMMMLRNVLRVDPSRENVLNVIGSMIESGMYREAMFLCYDLEKELPPDPLLRRLRGNAEYMMGDYMKASVSFAAAAELSPHDAVIWHSKGMADEARGDYQSAEESYDRAILLDLNESEFWISKAAIQERFGDRHGAVESLNRAIELDPESIYPIVRKAAIMESDGRYEDALHLLNICSVIDPRNTDVALMRARVMRESGQKDSALELARRLDDVLKSEDSAIELASCLVALGRRADALKLIEGALKDGKSDGRLELLLESVEKGTEDLVEYNNSVEVQIQSTEDVDALVSMAESLLVAGDAKGALRSIDRAAAMSDDVSVICKKCEIMLMVGEVQGAYDLITDALKGKPRSAELHAAMGSVKFVRSEFRGSIQELDKAIELGLNTPDILAKKGDAQQSLGYYDKSIESYLDAVKKNPTRYDLEYRLSKKLYERGSATRALSHIKNILEKKPDCVQAIILYAIVQKDSRHDDEVTKAYEMFVRCNDVAEEDVRKMVEILKEAGHDDQAEALLGPKESKVTDKKVKRSAEKVLRRAYTSRRSPYDIDMIRSLGFEDGESEEILAYLSEPVEYGDIVTGSTEFQKMERSSNDVVMKLTWKNLEERSELPLESVFVQCSFKEADDAKRVIAYIAKAMKADVAEDQSLNMVLDRVQGTSVYDIMKACKVGVYQARQIQRLL